MNKQKLSILTLIVITIGLLGIPSIIAQTIQDSAICYGYGTDLQPNGVGKTIFPYTEKVGFWVKIQDPPEVTYRMIWTDPSGNQFRNNPLTVVDKEGADWGIVFDSINVAESTAKDKLGVWTVSLYIDGDVEAEREFQIIDYNEIWRELLSNGIDLVSFSNVRMLTPEVYFFGKEEEWAIKEGAKGIIYNQENAEYCFRKTVEILLIEQRNSERKKRISETKLDLIKIKNKEINIL